MKHLGSYVDMPWGPQHEDYATAGLGTGIDISHYGAPYAQMLGLGDVRQALAGPRQAMAGGGDGLGMLYRYGAGLGAAPPVWTGAPAEDPRMLKRYSKVKSTYAVSNVPGAKAGTVADLLLAAARAKFPGNTVRKIGSTGWIAGGRVGFEVIVAQPMRLGEFKSKSKAIELANPLASKGGLPASAALSGASTSYNQGDLMSVEEQTAASGGAPTPESTGTTPPDVPGGAMATPSAPEFPWKWIAVGTGAVALIGIVAAVAMKKPARAPTPNRRRRSTRRRRSSRGRRRRS
jgi:hypothetical protein